MPDDKRYMLDTNIASHLIKGDLKAPQEHLLQVPMSRVYISAITEAELLRGVAKKPEAKRLPMLVNEFLLRVEILPWDSKAAQSYARLRTACEKEGKSLGSMDMLIAAHANAETMVLVTHDGAFYNVAHLLTLEDWVR